MTRIAPIPPAETDLLCEFCGYTLNGLNEQSKCPECGMPIVASLGQKRHPPLWEQKERKDFVNAFLVTTTRIMFRPTAFFQGITTRGDVRRAARFGHAHWIIASLLFGVAASFHADLFNTMGTSFTRMFFTGLPGVGVFFLASYFGLWATTWIAVRLTAWEAAYRGYRLPLTVVMRGMYYHAAHYLPVGVIAAATVVGYHVLYMQRHLLDETTLTTYLYVLCAEIIVAAAYLFKTYWIGMRNMMYANR